METLSLGGRIHPDALAAYVTAGKCNIILVSTTIDRHYGYTIRQWVKVPEMFYVTYHSDHPYQIGYFKVVNGEWNFYFRGDDTPITSFDPAVRAFRYLIEDCLGQNKAPEKLQAWHDGSCARCGRMLTDPASIEKGFGTECWKKVLKGI